MTDTVPVVPPYNIVYYGSTVARAVCCMPFLWVVVLGTLNFVEVSTLFTRNVSQGSPCLDGEPKRVRYLKSVL